MQSYIGKVKDVNYVKHTIAVEINVDTHTVQQIDCVYVAGIMSTLVGFNTTFLPAIGTRVFVILNAKAATNGFIIGCLPEVSVLSQGHNTKCAYGESTVDNLKGITDAENGKKAQTRHRPASDILEGEFDLSNLLGVGISLLTTIAKMQAGDLAKVECHLLDDMVRILSDKFKHHTAFGDYEIYNDNGKLNVRWFGTNAEFEAYGQQIPLGEPKAILTPTTDIETTSSFTATGRWRFQSYIGALGDFINIFISDPVGSLSGLAASGRARLHVNEDGGVLVQSVSDIILERVVKIPVPIETFRYDDPIADIPELIEMTPPYMQWEADITNLNETIYKIRDYARWYSNWYSMAAFRMSNRYYVPGEVETALPEMNNANRDKTGADTLAPAYWYKYATIRIFRDGSILLYDAYGSAVNMSNRDVTISAARNLNLEAANHITLKAGNDVYVNARRHVEIVAEEGGFFLSCASWLKALCKRGITTFESRYTAGMDETSPNDQRAIVVTTLGTSHVSIDSGSFIVNSTAQILLKTSQFFLNADLTCKINRGIDFTMTGISIVGDLISKGAAKFMRGIDGWGYTLPVTGPIPLVQVPATFPLVIASVASEEAALRLNPAINEAKVVKPHTLADAVVNPQKVYDSPTMYQSLTQQHLELSVDPEDLALYSDHVSTDALAYPGLAKPKMYIPKDPTPLDSGIANTNILTNTSPPIQTPVTSFKYLNPIP